MNKGEEIKEMFEAVICQLRSTLVYFDYNQKAFGNIVARVKDIRGKVHLFILDRDSIFDEEKDYDGHIDYNPNDDMYRYRALLNRIIVVISRANEKD